ncbi:LysR family transcriptional regulator [Aliamphritea ceti]|uniref:LysR family transcriptional regulator n=1 Tax=Aliamphritea ceti TaxID=1524258 RepID=UPI0021C2B601|nr:LysR family transcriptional regulator [Aliamphritea ceti]
MINPVYLRTFMRLVKTSHFTRTAQQLNMTQPGVSQHIKKLEAQLGKALLSRQGKGFELTAAGDILYQYGITQAEAESELLNSIGEDDSYSGDCKLTCSGSMSMLLYPQLLNFQQQYPDLSISIEAAPNAAIIELIRANKSDIGLMTQPVNDPTLKQELVGEDSLCLVLPKDAKSGWQDLMALGFINHPDGHHYAIQLLEANYTDEYQGMRHISQSGYINQLSQILLPVSQGLGFTVIPQSSLEAFPYPDKICCARLSTPVNESVYLVTKKHRELPKRYNLIRTQIKALIR